MEFGMIDGSKIWIWKEKGGCVEIGDYACTPSGTRDTALKELQTPRTRRDINFVLLLPMIPN